MTLLKEKEMSYALNVVSRNITSYASPWFFTFQLMFGLT